MTGTEVGMLLAVAEEAYPEKTAFWNDATKLGLAKAWTMALNDYSYEEGSTALRVYLKSDKYNRFPGAGQIANIIEELKESANPEYMTPAEAWAIVRPAIRNGIYGSATEFDKFPAIVKEAIGSPDRLRELALMESTDIDTVEKSNFCNRTFPAVIDRHKEANRRPVDVQAMIEKKRAKEMTTEKERVQAITEVGDEQKLIEYTPSGIDHSEEHNNWVHEEIMRRREDRRHKTATAKGETA